MENINGKGAKLIIVTEYLYFYDWLTYVCWFSLYKNLPDAEVFLYSINKEKQYFSWAEKLKVKFIKTIPENCLFLTPFHLMVRDLKVPLQDIVSCEVASDETCPFVNYHNGFGNFKIKDWIDSTNCGLDKVSLSENYTVNEWKVLQIWHNSFNLYQKLMEK